MSASNQETTSKPNQPSSAKLIYFIRHAESYYNTVESDPLSTHDPALIDCGITPLGFEQIVNLKATLQPDIATTFQVILISPLHRAQQTYELLELPITTPCITLPALREFRQATCDFLKGEEIRFESLAEIKIRTLQLLHYLIMERSEAVIACICHADLIWYLTAQVDGYKEKGLDGMLKELEAGVLLQGQKNDQLIQRNDLGPSTIEEAEYNEEWGTFVNNADYYVLEWN